MSVISSLAPLKSVCRDVATRANDLLDFALLEPPTPASSGKKGGGSSLPSGTAPLLQALQVQGTYYMSARSWVLHGRVASSIAAKLSSASPAAAAAAGPSPSDAGEKEPPRATAVHAALLAQARGPCSAASDAVGVLLQEWRTRLVAVRAAAAPLYPYLAVVAAANNTSMARDDLKSSSDCVEGDATGTRCVAGHRGDSAASMDPDMAAQLEEVVAQVQALIAQLDDGVRLVHAICADVERHVRAATDTLAASDPNTMTPVGAGTTEPTSNATYRWDLSADQLRVYSFTLMRHPFWRLRATAGSGGMIGGGNSLVSARTKAARVAAVAEFLA